MRNLNLSGKDKEDEVECFMCEKLFPLDEINVVVFRTEKEEFYEVHVCDECIGEFNEGD